MHLKKHYHTDANGQLIDPPRVKYVEIKHTGLHAEQHFSVKLIAQGVTDGWMVIDGNQLTIKAVPEDLRYTIVRVPGVYGDDIIHYYDCVLNAEQHDKFHNKKVRV